MGQRPSEELELVATRIPAAVARNLEAMAEAEGCATPLATRPAFVVAKGMNDSERPHRFGERLPGARPFHPMLFPSARGFPSAEYRGRPCCPARASARSSVGSPSERRQDAQE